MDLDKKQLEQQYAQIKGMGLYLDMSRGRPGPDVVDLVNEMLTLPANNYKTSNNIDCRNYGILDGIPEIKKLFAPMLECSEEELIIGGNSSLQLMYDTIVRAMLLGTGGGSLPWHSQKPKFLCPVPGYDRHFAICESLSIEMINIPTDENGPNMDMVEELVASDKSIKGIWCVPMYANPTGIVYSDETVRRMAKLKPAADDFRIFWDNAYCIHHLTDNPPVLLNILDECKKAGNPDMVYVFASTSKISFPGGGIAMLGASKTNADYIRKHMGCQTIGSDKLNQLRHVQFFKDYDGVKAHMELIRKVLQPKFEAVLDVLSSELNSELGEWHVPQGGYFISFNGKPGTAKRIVELCKEAGVVLTGAGATFPYLNDPEDRNIRIAPTFPTVEELRQAMEIFCISVKLATI
ncbi:MAG: aminotransferase class I/II-fold pyridoxal phosphate-dependent enzyme [Oscillospiraceae bacterium]|nr:aminotransferase class I/II-fold pyridoxal phosphate-dependent enzyme [Oscillospiraceae bacterium]